MGIETYRRRKQEGKCPHCSTPCSKGTSCEKCLEKIRKYQHDRIMNMSEERYKDYLDAKAYSTAKRQKYLRDNKICVTCGKKKATKGVRCSYCRDRHNAKNRKYYRENKDGN